MTAKVTHRVPFAVGGAPGIGMGNIGKVGHMGGGIGGINPGAQTPTPHMMSPSQGSPWYVRSDAHEMAGHAPKLGAGMAEGGIAHMAGGGMMPMSQASPWTERADARIMDQPFSGGLIGGSGAGRTDQLPLAVGSDSHIMPADVVSGLGQGHTLAGARILDAALKGGPFGTPEPKAFRGHGPPAPPHPANTGMQSDIKSMDSIATGGRPHSKTSILAASGEFVVEPADVEALGERGIAQGLGRKNESAMDIGHRLLDELIARVRKFNINWLKSAPAPKK